MATFAVVFSGGPVIRRSWRTALKNASTEKDVLAVVAGFLSEWSPMEIALLPAGAWPARIASRRDLLAHAAALAPLHARFEDHWEALRGLQELLLFMTHAAVAIARIAESR